MNAIQILIRLRACLRDVVLWPCLFLPHRSSAKRIHETHSLRRVVANQSPASCNIHLEMSIQWVSPRSMHEFVLRASCSFFFLS